MNPGTGCSPAFSPQIPKKSDNESSHVVSQVGMSSPEVHYQVLRQNEGDANDPK